jgi:hypothetical protein
LKTVPLASHIGFASIISLGELAHLAQGSPALCHATALIGSTREIDPADEKVRQ